MPDLMIRRAQECAAPFASERRFESSDKTTTYVARIIRREDPDLDQCTCPGKRFRGDCKHVRALRAEICTWREVEGPETQTPQQEMEAVCPRCGGETRVTRITG